MSNTHSARGANERFSRELPLGASGPVKRKSVLIVGGGVSGLAVAYELSRSGQFDICVCEQNPELGGKARSLRTLMNEPTEHAMRVFLASYTCLFRIMQEVCNPDGSPLMNNLRYPRFSFRFGTEQCEMSARYQGLLQYLRDAWGMIRFFLRTGVGAGELAVFLFRVARILWSPQSEVNRRMGRVSFEEYMDGQDRSVAFRRTLLRVSEMLVAAKRTASAALVARLVLEWFVGPFLRSPFHRLGFASLNGPTSERLIDPWAEHLRQQGVRFRLNTPIVELLDEAHEITGAITDAGERLVADYYCLCLPHFRLDALIHDRLSLFVPTIAHLSDLGEEWAAGIQYYLPQVPECLQGTQGLIVVDVGSPWSIVYMLHAEGAPWAQVPLPEGTIAVLSLVMSNGRNAGQHVTSEPFVRCKADEMKNEALAQIGLLDQLRQVPYAIGPDLQFVSYTAYAENPARYRGYGVSKIDQSTVLVSDGLLYVRTPRNLDEEPPNFTDIQNLFIAGEFTRTKFSIPTMEKCCESAMCCASALYEANGLVYDESRLMAAELPFRLLRSPWFHSTCRAGCVVLLVAIVWLLARYIH